MNKIYLRDYFPFVKDKNYSIFLWIIQNAVSSAGQDRTLCQVLYKNTKFISALVFSLSKYTTN